MELTDLMEEYEFRLVMRDDLHDEDFVLKPFDAVLVEDWKDMQDMCGKSFEAVDVGDDPSEIDNALNNLNPVPMHCSHGDGYEGSMFIILPYTADIEFQKLMNVAVHAYRDSEAYDLFMQVFVE